MFSSYEVTTEPYDKSSKSEQDQIVPECRRCSKWFRRVKLVGLSKEVYRWYLIVPYEGYDQGGCLLSTNLLL